MHISNNAIDPICETANDVVVPTSSDETTTPAPIYSMNNILTYSVRKQSINNIGSLINQGTDGSIIGTDVCILETNSLHCRVNVCVIDNHELMSIPIVTCTGVITTQKRPFALNINQYASIGKGHSIHSSVQL